MREGEYEFTQEWFSKQQEQLWTVIFDTLKPSKILEIGSFEGMSTCWMIDKVIVDRPIEMFCIDSWRGGFEHVGIDFAAVEKRFDTNVNKAINDRPNTGRLIKVKGRSIVCLSQLVATNVRDFDLVYVDGSHESPDVIADMVLGWDLLRAGGLMICDDYNNPNSATDPMYPRLAIDSFLKIYDGRWSIVPFTADGKSIYKVMEEQGALIYQLYIQKVA